MEDLLLRSAATEQVRWVDQFRPTSLSDVKGQWCTSLLDQLTVLPHLILEGPPGTGKTTTARLLAAKHATPANVTYCNASMLTRLEDLKKLWKNLPPVSSQPSVVILDECDRFTNDMLKLLRGYLDQQSHLRRFIFVCNVLYQMSSHTQSRVLVVSFKPIHDTTVHTYVQSILAQTSNTLPPATINSIVQRSQGDLRKALGLAQHFVNTQAPAVETPTNYLSLVQHPLELETWLNTHSLEELLDGLTQLILTHSDASIWTSGEEYEMLFMMQTHYKDAQDSPDMDQMVWGITWLYWPGWDNLLSQAG